MDLEKTALALGISKKRLQCLPMEALHTSSLDSTEDFENTLSGSRVASQYPAMALESLLTILSPRERFLMDKRHGLTPGEGPKPLHEVAKLMGISRQRVQQIEQRAIERMRLAGEKRSIDL